MFEIRIVSAILVSCVTQFFLYEVVTGERGEGWGAHGLSESSIRPVFALMYIAFLWARKMVLDTNPHPEKHWWFWPETIVTCLLALVGNSLIWRFAPDRAVILMPLLCVPLAVIVYMFGNKYENITTC